MTKADQRSRLGHPPGKSGSCGDALNWECLLGAVPKGENLNLVSGDKDYTSEINKKGLKQFLLEEWRKKKESEVFFFARLTDFFEKEFPDIRLAEELEKRTAIEDLANSGTFTNTHRAIESLSRFGDFSEAEISEILEAALSNSQIHLICGDQDVRDFFNDFIRRNESLIDPSLLTRFKNVYMSEGSNEV